MGDGMPNIDTGVPCHICPKGFEAEPACRQLIPKDFVLNPVTFWCNQCRPGYYQDIENSENPCRVCVSGPQDKYTIIVQNCTKQSNIQTACVEGYYMEIPNTRCILCPDHRKERLNSRAFEECFAFYEVATVFKCLSFYGYNVLKIKLYIGFWQLAMFSYTC